jgi:pimeloyl-ACP methyl ester carboxylesterase
VTQSLVIYTVATTLLQDILPQYQPSRITTSELLSKYNMLPSRYSKYSTISPDLNYRVHYLKREAMASHHSTTATDTIGTTTTAVAAIHVNHGFGASSLSWLPTIPLLSRTFNTTVLGHDAPGFGWTDRSDDDVSHYTISNSATIGTLLVQEQVSGGGGGGSGSSGSTTSPTGGNQTPTVVLIGHSLGSLTTLCMALQLTRWNPLLQLHVILVAPAVGLRKQTAPKAMTSNVTTALQQQQQQQQQEQQPNNILRMVRRPLARLGTSVACYGLKRFVGRRNFWRNGLRAVWGHPHRVRDSDVVRFEWHSIVQGWEAGLIQFARVQASCGQSLLDMYTSDQQLVDAVVNLPNLSSIHVMVGSKDRIVSPQNLEQFFRNYSSIQIQVMDGLGHDPFEENAGLFVEMVQSLLQL